MALAELDFDPLAGAGNDFGNPALWVIGGTFVFATVVAMGAAFLRKNMVTTSPVGLVDVSTHRAMDVIGVGWIVGIYLWLSMVHIVMASSADAEQVIGIADLWVSMGFHGVMAGMVILVMSPRIGVIEWLGLRWQRWRLVMIFAPLSVVAMWLVFGILQAAGYTQWLESLGIDTVQDSVRALQKEDDLAFLVLMRFSAIVVAPICEEVVFRGYLYGVAKRYCGPLAGALCSALIFSAAHASLAALLPLALFGLLLAWLYERTGSLWTPIAAHACFNAATVVVLMIQ
jgi:membrane protease YdiL (CAAX protease family)